MVKGGMSPLDAISMATSEPARILGINAGVLEPGRFADICLVEGDPDRSISALRNMRKVFKEGVMVYDSDKRLDP
jgi:imidazolonepropionase-like amidohydrolase